MRVAVVMFLFLFLMILTGSDPVNDGTHHSKANFQPAQHSEKIQQTKLGYTGHGFPVIVNNNLTEKKDDFISIDDDDEEVVFSKKYVLVTKQIATLAYSSVTLHFYNDFKTRLPFCRHFSYTSSFKYILQRVLRL